MISAALAIHAHVHVLSEGWGVWDPVEALDVASADAQCVDLLLKNPIQLLDKKGPARLHA
jgi:hypothetical protein